MKTKFTKKEKDRIAYLQKRYDKLEKLIEVQEDVLTDLRKESNRVFGEFCQIINPDPLPFDKKLLPYGW